MKAEPLYPEAFLRCMKPEDRQSLGKGGLLPEEAILVHSAKLEKTLHRLISQELSRRGIVAIHSAMHRRTTQTKGVPDFIFCLPNQQSGPTKHWELSQPWAIEAKTSTGQLRPEQEQMLEQMKANGWSTGVVRSFDEFRELVFGA